MPAPKPLTRLIELLHEALRAQVRLSPDDPRAQEPLAELEAFVPALLAELGPIRLETTGVGFLAGGEPVNGAPNAGMALARELDARAIGGLELLPGLDPADLGTLLFVLQMRPARLAEMGGAAALLPEDGPLRALPRIPPAPSHSATPLQAVDVNLDWTGMFQKPAVDLDALDPIPWVDAAPAAPLPVTVPQAFPEPEPLTADELSRVARQAQEAAPAPAPTPAPQPEPAEPGPLSPAALREELAGLFTAALDAAAPVDKAGPRSPWGVDHREALNRCGFQMADLTGLEGTGARLGLDRTDPATVRDALRRVFAALEPIQQGNLLLGLPGFPAGEHALKRALDFLAPELLAQAVAHVHLTRRPSLFDLALLTVALMQCVPDRDLSLEAIRGRLQFEGWGMQEMEDFKEAIQWECQGTDTKLHLSLERHAIHKLDVHLVMTLGRQLIRAKRVDDLRSMLAQLEEELASPQEAVRRHGTEIIANLAEGMAGASLPLDLENRMLAAARDRLSAESDQLVTQWCAQTVEAILNRWLASDNLAALHGEVRNLGDLAYPPVGASAWKPQLLRDLLARLGSAENINRLLPLLHQDGGPLPLPHLHALFALMGAPAATHVAAALEAESDPGRRLRLGEALRAIGRRAVPALADLLGASQPHLVEQALHLLGEAGDPSVLEHVLLAVGHRETSVRQAAVAAVAALAGKPVAARALADTLAGADLPAQLDSLTLLADLGDPVAVPAVLHLLTPDKAAGEDAQRLRLRAVETLGKLPSSESVGPLRELFQKKGLFKREPLGLRLAAARALADLNTQEAREDMALALDSEPAEEVKAVLRQYLVR